MAGNKCEYLNCGISRRVDPESTFHRFPKQPRRCGKWIVNSGRDDFRQLSINDLHKKVLCSRHFRESDKCKSGRLKKFAIPLMYFKDLHYSVQEDLSLSDVANENDLSDSTEDDQGVYIKGEPDRTSPSIYEINDLDSSQPSTLRLVKKTNGQPDRTPPRLYEENDLYTSESSTMPPIRKTYARKLRKSCDTLNVNRVKLESHEQNRLKSTDLSELEPQEEYENYSINVVPARDMTNNATWQVMVKKRLLLEMENAQLKKQLSENKKHITRLRKKMTLVCSANGYNARWRNRHIETIVNMQLLHKRKWLKREKQLSLALYNRSPRSYTFMLDKLHLRLPSVRVIQQIKLKKRPKIKHQNHKSTGQMKLN